MFLLHYSNCFIYRYLVILSACFIFRDSSFEEESADEYDGYDPVHSRLVDDKVTYRPRYAPSEHNEDSSSDDLNDEPEDRASYSHYFPHSPVGSPDERPVVKSEQNESQKSTDNDREYHVEPVVDVTTPCYAPSQALSRTPESSPALSYTASEHASDVVPTKKVESNIPERIAELEESEDNNSSSSESDIDEYSPDVQQHESDKSRDDLVENVPQTKSGSPAEPEHYKEFHGIFEDNDEEQDQGKFNEDFEGFERDEQPESQVDGIIADIFGESDAEEEFEGFAENELDKGIEEEVEIQTSEQVSHKSHKPTSAENDDDEESGEDDEFVSDFDRIMAKKKEELRRRRKRNRDIEFLNDSDDLIVEMISRMKNAADEDRQLLSAGQPATKKLSMFKDVSALLRRADLKSALIENGMLSAITEWLSPLPGHTLPNLIIRDSMLTSLSEFQSLSPEVLQESGIGKALMYLYKHPRETRENKDKAGRLINEWLRPIFNLKSDYRTLTKEERKQLDYEHLPKRRNIE
ncbi:unnamed protein product [Trichobilharzia regenti]|nr:unnamed protein product [Trichobilharzia regenti]